VASGCADDPHMAVPLLLLEAAPGSGSWFPAEDAPAVALHQVLLQEEELAGGAEGPAPPGCVPLPPSVLTGP